MKPVVVAVVGLVAGLAGGAVVLLAGAGESRRIEPSLLVEQQRALTDVHGRLEQLETSVRRLQERGNDRGGRSAVSLDEMEQLVERVLARREALGPAPAEARDAAPSGEPSERLTAEAAFARLAGGTLSESEWTALWARVRDEGLTDELLALFEQRAQRDPHDLDAQLALGRAYLEKIQEVAGGPLAGVYATKADEAFDAVLSLEPSNWDARFTKAVALSFWPPIFGKQPEAVKQFEVLLEQQRSQPVQPHFAQTYLLLGNLYVQQGKHDLATAIWREGSLLFPDHGEIAQKLGP